MRITLKKVQVMPEKGGFRLTVDITLIHAPNWIKYAEILRGYIDKKYSLWGAILMGFRAWAGIKRK